MVQYLDQQQKICIEKAADTARFLNSRPLLKADRLF
jgi:hypothetical protein